MDQVKGMAAIVLCGVLSTGMAHATPADTPLGWQGEPIELTAGDREIRQVRAILTPIDLTRNEAVGEGGIAGGCDQEQVTHTDASFEGGAYTLQAGFEEGEVFAHSYTINPDHFPFRLDSVEGIFATLNAAVSTTTHWSVLVWEGTPANGSIVAEFSSDDVILPHIHLPPGTNGVNVFFTVDPKDPDQIIVNNNGSNTFSVGYRIDQHNNPGNPCVSAPPSNQNAFPVTDLSGVESQPENWLCGVTGTACICAPGVCQSFSQLLGAPGQLCTPSGDWVLRATYTPQNCAGQQGACCLADGACLDGVLEPDCGVLGGTFQGDGSDCVGEPCPAPEGACCFTGGGCVDLSAADCGLVGGFWQGAGTDCGSTNCFETGACCMPDGSCIEDQDPTDCANAGGTYQGADSTCGGSSCPQPEGACCFANGACLDLTEENCLGVPGNIWLGFGSSCDTANCEPEGACCFETGVCLILTETECDQAPNSSWLGAGSTCDGDPCTTCPYDCGTVDQTVDIQDLLALLSQWGSGGSCDQGVAGVDIQDLLGLLAAWGDCQ